MALTRMWFLRGISGRAAEQVVNRFHKKRVKAHAMADRAPKAMAILNGG